MTYLEALRRKLGVETIDEVLEKVVQGDGGGNFCPNYWDLGDDECPATKKIVNCLGCWARKYPDPVVLEEVESYYPCTVQILRNPKTGEESVGWFRGQMDGE